MGNQSSEMKDKYKGEPEVTMETRFSDSFQPPKLHDHHVNGPSKVRYVMFVNCELGISQREQGSQSCINEQNTYCTMKFLLSKSIKFSQSSFPTLNQYIGPLSLPIYISNGKQAHGVIYL